MALCRGLAPFRSCRVPSTGLGGHDSGRFKDYDICIRTDKHSQSISGLQ